MANLLYNKLIDPWNNDSYSEYPLIQSTYYGGDYDNIIAPSTPNFPPVTPGRYFVPLPVIPYVEDTITYPIGIRDVTNSVNLTYTAGAPGVNQYRYAPNSSTMPHMIELNAVQSGSEIGFSYYGMGSILFSNYDKKLLIRDSIADSINTKTIESSNNWTETSLTGSNTYTIPTTSLLDNYKKILILLEIQKTTDGTDLLNIQLNNITGANDYSWTHIEYGGGTAFSDYANYSNRIPLGNIYINSTITSNIEISLIAGRLHLSAHTFITKEAEAAYRSSARLANGTTRSVSETNLTQIILSTGIGTNFTGNAKIQTLKL